MSRILLLLDQLENRRLLLDQLRRPRYQVILPADDQALAEQFDLCIMDGMALERLGEVVQQRKQAEAPVFLPVLCVTSRQDVGLVTRQLWRSVDELIITPIERVELQARVEVLLRARQLSLDLEGERQELARERAFITASCDSLPFPAAFVAPGGESLRLNPAGGRFLEQLRVGNWWDLPLRTPDTHLPLPREQHPLARALRGEELSGVEAEVEVEGEVPMPVLIYAVPVRVSEQLVAVVLALQDITPIKEADRAKDQFLAVISHELLTPVSTILGWLDMAEKTPEIVPQALEVTRRNAMRQQRLVEDLLDVSRIIHGKFRLAPQAVDLWQLAEQCLQDVQVAAAERGLVIRTSPPDQDLPVEADPARIRQAISNLLNNALKFTDPGGTISVAAGREGEMAVLSVADTGRGIPAEQMEMLFEPFRQLALVAGGLGLGLPLVKGIVEMHGGRVTASSPGVGRGSVFTIRLPLRTGVGREAEEVPSAAG